MANDSPSIITQEESNDEMSIPNVTFNDDEIIETSGGYRNTELMNNRKEQSNNDSPSLSSKTQDDKPEDLKRFPANFFHNNNCKYGASRKDCRFSHPKVCRKLISMKHVSHVVAIEDVNVLSFTQLCV